MPMYFLFNFANGQGSLYTKTYWHLLVSEQFDTEHFYENQEALVTFCDVFAIDESCNANTERGKLFGKMSRNN
eukprot:scaffold557961_cov16-Prasinocladus_malaysianus.AAC.1